MRLGYFTMPLHPVGRDWRQTLAEDREADQAHAAESAGSAGSTSGAAR